MAAIIGTRPVVLSFSGHDPSGGAGIQADIETLISHSCHSASVITALTEQDTRNVNKIIPQKPKDIIAQAQTLLADLPVKVFKIGLIGHAHTAKAIASILTNHAHIPVVLDPVLAAGGGALLADGELIAAIKKWLLPQVTIITPNGNEARKLTGFISHFDCGLALLAQGCQYALITGGDEATVAVHNQLFHQNAPLKTYTWDRLPFSYHGSGCTLSSTIAALLAQGFSPEQAIAQAQAYTWKTLQAAYCPGKGQYNPLRLLNESPL